jgi:tetratricopeptide (TPR) repeat protein
MSGIFATKVVFAATLAAAAFCAGAANAADSDKSGDPSKLCLDTQGHVDLAKFIAACTAVIDSNSYGALEHAAAYANRASSYVTLGLYDRAVDDCEKSRSLDSGSGDAAQVYICGNAYRGQKDWTHAIEEYNRAIELWPYFTDAFIARGQAYEKLGDHDRAMDNYTDAVNLPAHTAGEFRARARAHVLLNEYSKAVADYDNVVRLQPDDPSALGCACWYRAQLNLQLDVAMRNCNTAIERDSSDSFAMDSRALVFLRIDAWANVIADTNDALAINPKKPTSLYMRGIAKLRTGDTAGGNADIAAATAIDPKIAETFAGYGVKP